MHESQTVWLAETQSLLKLRPTDALLQITLTLIFQMKLTFLNILTNTNCEIKSRVMCRTVIV